MSPLCDRCTSPRWGTFVFILVNEQGQGEVYPLNGKAKRTTPTSLRVYGSRLMARLHLTRRDLRRT